MSEFAPFFIQIITTDKSRRKTILIFKLNSDLCFSDLHDLYTELNCVYKKKEKKSCILMEITTVVCLTGIIAESLVYKKCIRLKTIFQLQDNLCC